MRIKRQAGKRLGAPRKPDPAEIRALLGRYGIEPAETELIAIHSGLGALLDELSLLDELQVSPTATPLASREPGYRPGDEEDRLNAFITRCRVTGAAQGKLAGKTVGLKDAICVAGVPCTNATNLLAHFVPQEDATVVQRLLAAGAEITGKLNMAAFSAEATSIDSDFGIVRNPHNPAHSAGGSSSGCGAAVANGDVDLALGADGGGSGRIPAAWCGCVALKPTRGLVPAHGVISFNPTLDAVSPTARSVAEVAITLEVIAGADGVSANQTCYGSPARVEIPTDDYTRYLSRGVRGLKIGLIKEAMEWAHAEEDVLAAVRQAARTFTDLGANCSEVSFPLLRYAVPAHRTLIVVEAAAMYDAPDGYFRLGPYNEQWAATFDHLFKAHPNQLPFTMKSKVASGNYLRREHYVRYYAKAQNVRRALEAEMNALLVNYDLLMLPTVPFKAPAYADLDGGAPLVNQMLLRVVGNLCVFNLLGHPALTLPCGRGEHNLPIGLQLAGRHFGEGVLFQAAQAFEDTFSLY